MKLGKLKLISNLARTFKFGAFLNFSLHITVALKEGRYFH